MKYAELAEIIIGLKDEDLELRGQLVRDGALGNGYHEAMQALHNRNAAELAKIIDTIGYPTIDKVGEAASRAAWLVVQHSIGQPGFMRRCLALLAEAVTEGKADPRSLAYLSDRIASFEGKPQLYGTQFDWDEEGMLSPVLSDDLERVDQRRKALGLNSMKEQTERIRKQARMENQTPPRDFAERSADLAAWKRRVGWI